ncbi:universal stress protein [Deinococcus yavapaiensis]|uniref:Nucleotide-binding universal stress UspA family protein n=1 Tax=Deinococcus yavapaiensis KR-236 TaxID=694435 RepID=A0A318S7W7_9DEIO|nr:universal stress protein [Deinococcus yavapaiensis]PYE54542.1 nucleotide-binding universal stress UspA family protein [Deinococcus yavapaiensis KR-236]
MTPALSTFLEETPLSPALPGRPVVLIATDGSPTGTLALDRALDAARVLGARLCVLHVLPDPLPSGRPELYDVQLTVLRRGGEAVLNAAKRRLRFVGADFVLRECRGQHVANVILDEAKRLGAISVVLGTHGRPRPYSRTLGSVARAVRDGAWLSVTLVDKTGDVWQDKANSGRALS